MSPFPSRFIVSDRSSPSRVRFAASRHGRLRADPKDALLTRGRGGIEIQQGGERVISNSEGRLGLHPGAFITHDKGYYHSLRRSRKGTFRPYQTP